MSSENFSTPFFLILASISPLSSLQSLRMPCAETGPAAIIPAASTAMMSLLMLFSLSKAPSYGALGELYSTNAGGVWLAEQPPHGGAAREKRHKQAEAPVAAERSVRAEVQAADDVVAPAHPQPVRARLVGDRRIEQSQ